MSRSVGWIVLAGLVVLAAAAATLALRFGLWADGEPGPGLFPLVACGLIAAAGCAVALEGAHPAETDKAQESTPTPGRLIATMAVMVAWPFLLQPLGYALASGFALIVLLHVGGVGWMANLAVAGAAVAGSHLLFVTLLEVPLPGAEWF